ncbi:MAG: hypothetical protein ACLFWL_09585 [Candidatus Brocadiia bacterium]
MTASVPHTPRSKCNINFVIALAIFAHAVLWLSDFAHASAVHHEERKEGRSG